MNDEEVAIKLVHLYFEEIARLGFKRQLDLDQILNAYFYTLKRLGAKDEALKRIVAEIKREEKEKTVKTQTKTETSFETKNFSNSSSVPVVKETTTVTTVEEKPKSISDILEGK